MSVAILESTHTARISAARARRENGAGNWSRLFEPATWQEYKTLQGYVEKWGGARVSYLDGTLQLMTVSLEQESRKSQLGFLLEAWLIEREIEFYIHGNATLERRLKHAGKEPDESYCFHTQKKVPDLVIEIALTHGGLDTLELYRRFKIPEVWIWQDEELRVFHLAECGYRAATCSRHFADLNLTLLARCARVESLLQARKQFLAGSRKPRRK
jgi:Uma2 family endonuclease